MNHRHSNNFDGMLSRGRYFTEFFLFFFETPILFCPRPILYLSVFLFPFSAPSHSFTHIQTQNDFLNQIQSLTKHTIAQYQMQSASHHQNRSNHIFGVFKISFTVLLIKYFRRATSLKFSMKKNEQNITISD